MPKKVKSTDEHLQTIEYLLAGLLLKNDVPVQQICKVLGVTTAKITKMFPQRRKKRATMTGSVSQSV